MMITLARGLITSSQWGLWLPYKAGLGAAVATFRATTERVNQQPSNEMAGNEFHTGTASGHSYTPRSHYIL